MRLTKEQIDNVICNIENAGHQEVVFNEVFRRFEFLFTSPSGNTPARIAITCKNVKPIIFSERRLPSDSLFDDILGHNWFKI